MSMATKFLSHYRTLSNYKAERLSRARRSSVKAGPGTLSLSSMVYVCHFKGHPFLYGVGSLGNVSGGYSRLRLYLGGNHIQDMRKDWLKVGEAFRESLYSYKK